jgi:aminoglycoside 6-adenylyltransferase
MAKEMPVIDELVRWAEDQPPVRAMLLSSSRAVPQAPVDVLSDYDVILVVRDVHPFFEDRAWLEDFGPVLVVYRDPLEPWYGFPKTIYVTQYEDGLKIDFSLWQVEALQRIVADPQLPDELDAGYRVLLDKDHLTDGLKPPSFKAYIPKPPAEAEYKYVVEMFFHEATYAAKYLWRADLIAAKYSLDYALKFGNLRTMLEWLAEIDHGWSLKPGPYGRGLKKYLKPALWRELEDTYVGAGIEENWNAFFRTIALFRKVALEVGDRLGYAYPRELDLRAQAYLEKVKNLDKQAGRFA